MLSRVPISARAPCNDRLPTRVAFILEKSIDACFFVFVFSSFFFRGASKSLFLPLLFLGFPAAFEASLLN